MKLNLPNQITLSRLLLAIIFFVLLSQFSIHRHVGWKMDLCLTLFVVAGVTDWLDGYLARRRNQITSLGRMLDPFVDKVLVCGAFILFTSTEFVNRDLVNVTGVSPWMVVIIVGRELLVTGLRGFSESRGKPFAADKLGKSKTIIQMVTAGWIMLYLGHGDLTQYGCWMSEVKTGLIWLTVLITAISGISYLYKAKDILLEES